MKVLIAPDKFAGTLTALEAANAIAVGWRRRCPEDLLTIRAMSDGGPGFIDVLHDALGGRLVALTARGPLGADTSVTLLHVDDCVYIESAQACGLGVVTERRPLESSSYGVGQAIRAALELDPRRIVVGLGGSATNDGGAGLLGALGARADVPLDQGPSGLHSIRDFDATAALDALDGVDLEIASDVTIGLLGMFGATKSFGPQKGLDDSQILLVDRILNDFVVAACGTTPGERRLADEAGSGAAGGIGFALKLLGGSVRSGIGLVADAAGVATLAAEHDLVITGEGSYDFSSRSGKTVFGVAECAGAAARPCIVLAGRVAVGAREMRAMGVESAYGVADLLGEERSLAEPAHALAELAERIAGTWSL